MNVLAGLAGNDKLYGMGGNDVLIGGAGADVLDGGTGTDTADYSTSASPVHLLLGGVSSGGDAQGDTFISIEKFVGTAGADVFDGSASLTGFSADGGGGGDTMIGGHGNDTLSIGGAAAAVAGFAALAGVAGGEVRGEDGDDDLKGSVYDDIFYDGNGNDSAEGGDGKDTFIVGQGQNSLKGGNDDDGFNLKTDSIPASSDGSSVTFDGGDGIDTVNLSSFETGTNVTLGDASASLATLEEGPYQMELTFGGVTRTYDRQGIERDILTPYDDGFFGNASNNEVFGEGGNDLIAGGDGSDVLDGGAGNDRLFGGFGNDVLTSGINDPEGGDEELYGEEGSDIFFFRSADELHPQFTRVFIQDFTINNVDLDEINLSFIDADSTTQEVNEAFTWIGDAEFSGNLGELRFFAGEGELEGYNVIEGNTDGIGGADIALLVHDSAGDPNELFFVL